MRFLHALTGSGPEFRQDVSFGSELGQVSKQENMLGRRKKYEGGGGRERENTKTNKVCYQSINLNLVTEYRRTERWGASRRRSLRFHTTISYPLNLNSDSTQREGRKFYGELFRIRDYCPLLFL